MAFTYRLEKGSPLTEQELDDNYREVANIAQITADEINKKVTADTNEAKKQANEAAKQALKARSEADRASQVTGLDTVADAIGLAAVPFPDVWIPFNDSLRMFAGFGRDVKVGSDVVATYVNYERATTATYTDKSGVLRTAAINEPRFEKEGLLIEGQSTNLITWSRGADYSKNPGFFANNATIAAAGDALTITSLNFDGGVGGVLQGVHAGKTTAVSLWAKGAKGGEKLKVGLYTDGSVMPHDIILTTEWARYSKTYTIAPDGQSQTSVRIYAQSACTFSIDKIQCEELPFASSYIPTTGAAVTRAADKCWIQWEGNVPQDMSKISFSMQFNVLGFLAHDRFQRIIWSEDSAAGPYFGARVKGIELRAISSTSGSSGMFRSNISEGHHQLSFSSGGDAVLNGVAANFDASTEPFVIKKTIGIGSSSSGTDQLFGHIRNLRICHDKLSSAQIKGFK